MEYLQKMKYFKITSLYIIVFILLSKILTYKEMVSIIFHCQPQTSLYLYFICFQFLWAYYYFIYINEYYQLQTFIRIRMTLKQYILKIFPKMSLFSLYYIILHILMFLCFFQKIPIVPMITNIFVYMFSSLFVLFCFSSHKYSFIYMVILIVFVHFIV